VAVVVTVDGGDRRQGESGEMNEGLERKWGKLNCHKFVPHLKWRSSRQEPNRLESNECGGGGGLVNTPPLSPAGYLQFFN